MWRNNRLAFAFGVLAFNHQDYILEHLESIKYLVLEYGQSIDVDLIINDDCSTDHTRALIDHWLLNNVDLFRNVEKIYNSRNLGTCSSVQNMLTRLVADQFKLSGGDDVYSFENIFELTRHKPDVAIISGRALYLWGHQLKVDSKSNFLSTATQVIYEYDSLMHRFKHLSYNNAPNMLYAKDCMLHSEVRSYLQAFDVTEDWPLQVSIARHFPERRFELIDQVLVYYRRTAGSAYIIANKRFIKDKMQMYEDLIRHESKWVERLRLASRKLCFKSENSYINKILNLDFYFFGIACVSKILKITGQNRIIDMRLAKHQQHYASIRISAEAINEHLNTQ